MKKKILIGLVLTFLGLASYIAEFATPVNKGLHISNCNGGR